MTIFERVFMTVTLIQNRREPDEENSSMVEHFLLI